MLQQAEIPATLFGARETTHNKRNADLGLPDDPATQTLPNEFGKYNCVNMRWS